MDPLLHFLRACFEEGDLSLVGRIATRWDVVRFLSNLLRLYDEETKRRPRFSDRPVERPIFISGLPRSGTTFLHSLLAEDPVNLVPRVWQLIHPYPRNQKGSDRPAGHGGSRGSCGCSACLSPDFRRMHPIDAGSPQECSEITAHVFASLRFDSTYRIPSYRHWLDETGHRRGLSLSQALSAAPPASGGDGGRWVLKCPDHVFALPRSGRFIRMPAWSSCTAIRSPSCYRSRG